MQQLKIVTDQMDKKVQFYFPPIRIISLVPSQTELLYYLGLHQEVIGQTLFCIHPQNTHQSKPRIGGTKKLNIKKILALKPDLIIGNKEENEQSQIETLVKHCPVWMSDITTLSDALDMIERVGELVNKKENALALVNQITASLHTAENYKTLTEDPKMLNNNKPYLTKKVLYLIWKNPYMAAGCNTFINDMLARCGLQNMCDKNTRYPTITNEEIKAAEPNYIFLSSEPYPFTQAHIDELKNISPSSKIILVNGEMFSWYGSRLLLAATYFNQLIKSL